MELRPPADAGFSGTAWFRSVADATLIDQLKLRGYTVVSTRTVDA